MPREKITFDKNTTVELALAYATGKRGENDNGEYFLYTTADDRIFFATPALNAKIQERTPGPFERLTITLLNNRATGNKNMWDVRRLDPIAPAAGGQDSRSSAASALITGVTAPTNGSTNGHHAPPPPPPAAPLMNGQAQHRLQFFTQAVDLCIAARHYAHLSGLEVEVKFEDIRAVANTLSISADKGGR